MIISFRLNFIIIDFLLSLHEFNFIQKNMFSALNNDQIIFATAGYDHVIRFWKPNTGQCYRCLEHKESVYKSILILDFFFFYNFLFFSKQVNCMAIYPDKSLLATGGIYNALGSFLRRNRKTYLKLKLLKFYYLLLKRYRFFRI